MKIGVMINLNMATLEESFQSAIQFGFDNCQLCCWDSSQFTEENAGRIAELKEQYNIDISAFWCGWEGPCEWNLVYGPSTIGLVPEAYRNNRMNTLIKCSDFIKTIGICDLVTHVGFIPTNPFSAEYAPLTAALRHLVEHCRKNGQFFLFETGQEPPVVLRRMIEDIGTDNLGVNLDPANILMYGMGNPIDAVDILHKFIRNIHGKDGILPTDGRSLGKELPVGDGMVCYPNFIKKLKSYGYDRYITIEREITGEQQKKDIAYAKLYLEKLLY